MLIDEDTPTIRHAINRRLGVEPGVTICDIKFERYRKGDWYYADPQRPALLVAIAAEPFIRVNMEAEIGLPQSMVSRFELPIPFEHGHLLEEIDEIAEQYKAARKAHFGHGSGLILTPERQLQGSGLRGRWSRYGLREPQNG